MPESKIEQRQSVCHGSEPHDFFGIQGLGRRGFAEFFQCYRNKFGFASTFFSHTTGENVGGGLAVRLVNGSHGAIKLRNSF